MHFMYAKTDNDAVYAQIQGTQELSSLLGGKERLFPISLSLSSSLQ